MMESFRRQALVERQHGVIVSVDCKTAKSNGDFWHAGNLNSIQYCSGYSQSECEAMLDRKQVFVRYAVTRHLIS